MIQSTIPENRKIRILLSGCGRISSNHLEAISAHPSSLELIGACDPDELSLKKVEAKFQVPCFRDFDEMIKKSQADLVVLCTPSGIHAEQAILAAKAGFHVLTEKPMATLFEDGEAMIEAFKAAKRNLFVVKQNRRNSTIQLLKKAIDENRFGKIYLVEINVFWQRPQSYYDQAPWRGTWKLDGGAFMNQASHYVDLLDWMIGPVDSVSAFIATLGRKIEAEDTGVVTLRWKNGALGSMNVTMLSYPKNLEGSITVLGEKGSAKIGGVAVNQIERWEFEGQNLDLEKIRQASYETESVYGKGHHLYYEDLILAMRGLPSLIVGAEEGLKSLEILSAIYQSAKNGHPVSLPLSRSNP